MPLSSNESAIIERPRTNSKVFCSHALGRDSRFCRPFTLRVLLRHVLSFSACPGLGHAHSRFDLFGEHLLEHQRRFAQFHSQSLFSVRLCSIGCSASWNQSQLALVKSSTNAFTCSITRETPTAPTSTVRLSIGFRFTSTVTRVNPSIPSNTLS